MLVRNGVEGKMPQKIGPGSAPRDGTWNLFRHFPRHPVSDRHFPKHFFGTSLLRGFSTSFVTLRPTIGINWKDTGFRNFRPPPNPRKRKVDYAPHNRRFRKGVGGRGLATNKNPKKSPKVLQKCVPILLRGHRKKGTEKRPESLGFEGFLRANPLCPPTPFRNF